MKRCCETCISFDRANILNGWGRYDGKRCALCTREYVYRLTDDVCVFWKQNTNYKH